MDTTINVADFMTIKGLDDAYEIPKGVPVEMGPTSCMFFLNRLSKMGQIEWIEPHIIADIRGLPIETEIILQVFTLTENGRNYFWLPENYRFSVGGNKVRIPETPTHIQLNAATMEAEKMYIDASLLFPEAIAVSQLASGKINMKIGVKIKIQTHSEIKL
ncbi:MAG: hypothetical protein LBD59_11870 [Prevotellaceae bacterium]|jgi:hypothetical protein|nr:hypothetical protein [Prevotellaceae bacterium]